MGMPLEGNSALSKGLFVSVDMLRSPTVLTITDSRPRPPHRWPNAKRTTSCWKSYQR